MPYNSKVDGCEGQIAPTPDDYFEYYPYMKKHVSWQQVHAVIENNNVLHNVFLDFCDKHWQKLSADFALKHYVLLLHTVVCKIYLSIDVKDGLKI